MTFIPEGYTLCQELSSVRQTQFSKAEKVLERDTSYQAIVETSKGRLTVELYAQDAPITVNNFVFLARNKYYDSIIFHRVLEDFMAQTGDPTGSGRGGPGYRFPDETDNGKTHSGKGILSMANSGPGTNGSQFFITFTTTPWLDGKHTVFGKVIEGLEVLDQLTRIDPMRPGGVSPDRMERVYIVEKAL